MSWNDEKTERRRADRFPIRREVAYKLAGRKGSALEGAGRTVNMSSTGVLFTTEHPLLTGNSVEVSISWPAQINSTAPIRLLARGRVVRSDEHGAAVEIQHTEFRTQAHPEPGVVH
jgi:PilZ domain